MNKDTKWEFYQDELDDWRWRARDVRNNKILFVSSEGYVAKRDAEACAKRSGWLANDGVMRNG